MVEQHGNQISVVDAQFVDRSVFRDVVGRFASGVTVITTRVDGRPFGTTASAMSSLSMDPPMILVCLNKTSETGAAVLQSGTFAVNILAKGQQDLAARFAAKGDDKFQGVDIGYGVHGDPLISGTLATIQCRTVETAVGGTHTVFLAEVADANARDLEPLTYFRGQFGRLEHVLETEAYETLREWVLTRAGDQGAEFDLEELRNTLGLDATHLSGALVKLAMERLVTRREDGRFVTTTLTVEVINGLLDARCAIEIGITDAHAATASAESVRALQRIAAELETIVHESIPDIDRFLDASHRYHAEYVGLGGCAQLVDAYARLGISGAWRNSIADRDWWNLFDVSYHRDLTTALQNRQVAEAKRLIYRHNDDVKQMVDRVIADRYR